MNAVDRMRPKFISCAAACRGFPNDESMFACAEGMKNEGTGAGGYGGGGVARFNRCGSWVDRFGKGDELYFFLRGSLREKTAHRKHCDLIGRLDTGDGLRRRMRTGQSIRIKVPCAYMSSSSSAAHTLNVSGTTVKNR